MTTFIEKQSHSHIEKESHSQGALELDQEVLLAQPERARRKYIRGSRPARVTKISIEQCDAELSSDTKPRLKTGVHISVPIA